MNNADILSAFKFFYLRENVDPARLQTWNPLIRSQMPYPSAWPRGFTYYIMHDCTLLSAGAELKTVKNSVIILEEVPEATIFLEIIILINLWSSYKHDSFRSGIRRPERT